MRAERAVGWAGRCSSTSLTTTASIEGTRSTAQNGTRGVATHCRQPLAKNGQTMLVTHRLAGCRTPPRRHGAPFCGSAGLNGCDHTRARPPHRPTRCQSPRDRAPPSIHRAVGLRSNRCGSCGGHAPDSTQSRRAMSTAERRASVIRLVRCYNMHGACQARCASSARHPGPSQTEEPRSCRVVQSRALGATRVNKRQHAARAAREPVARCASSHAHMKCTYEMTIGPNRHVSRPPPRAVLAARSRSGGAAQSIRRRVSGKTGNPRVGRRHTASLAAGLRAGLC